jgi:predicted outer membrane repeat protein
VQVLVLFSLPLTAVFFRSSFFALVRGIIIPTGLQVTIEGSGFSVDAASKGNFFNVSGTLGLNSLNLKNGAAPAVGLYSHGGAIYITSSGTVNMSYTNVTRCLSNPGMGGAIYNLGDLTVSFGNFVANVGVMSGGAIASSGKLSISTTNFTSNDAPVGYGGAIYTFGGELDLSYTSFVSNRAHFDGGAINAYTDITVNGGIFEANSASGAAQNSGGAISVGSEWKLEVNDAIFKSNQADFAGGAIDADDTVISGSSVFSNNSCGTPYEPHISPCGSDIYGAAIFVGCRNASMDGCCTMPQLPITCYQCSSGQCVPESSGISKVACTGECK